MDNTILLMCPNTGGSYKSTSLNFENLALGYLGAILQKEGFEIEIIDARANRMTPQVVAERIENIKPFFLGISVISEKSIFWLKELEQLLGTADYIKHISMGGHYPTLQPESVMEKSSFVNSVAVGEGDITIVELVKKVKVNNSWHDTLGILARLENGSVQINPRRPLIENLDILPFPIRYIDINTVPEVVIESSRGCLGRCFYCSIFANFKACKKLLWRGRSPEHIVAEMVLLRKRYGRERRFRFVDPDFFGSTTADHLLRIRKFALLVIEKVPDAEFYIETQVSAIFDEEILLLLQKAGLKEVYLGIESGSDKILKLMNRKARIEDILKAAKLLRKLGIDYEYGHMMITPWTDYNDIIYSLDLLEAIGRVQFDKLFSELFLTPGLTIVNRVGKTNALARKEGDGFYSYKMGTLIENVRIFGRIFETEFEKFCEDLWFLYKDIQRQEQCHISGAEALQSKLSVWFIGIFKKCLAKSNTDFMIDAEEAKLFITNIVTESEDFISSIKNSLDASVLYPRIN